MDELLPIIVTQTGEKQFTIEWNENDPATSHLNDWTEEDFLEAVKVGVAELLLEELDVQ